MFAVAIFVALVSTQPSRMASANERPLAHGSDVDVARRLQVQGQSHYDAQQFELAARTWARLLDAVPEPALEAERDNLLLITLDAYARAFESLRARTDVASRKRGVAILREASAFFDEFHASLAEIEGGAIAPSAAAMWAGVELRWRLAEAERELRERSPAEQCCAPSTAGGARRTQPFGGVSGLADAGSRSAAGPRPWSRRSRREGASRAPSRSVAHRRHFRWRLPHRGVGTDPAGRPTRRRPP